MRLLSYLAPAVFVYSSLAPQLLQAAPVPQSSFAPPAALGEVNDDDLLHEETLLELMQIEYDKDAWSMGTAVGLSLLPGGGYGLLYVNKPAQSAIPFAIFVVGAAVGTAYLLGAFDSSESEHCYHVRDGKVSYEECSIASNPVRNHDLDPRAQNYDAVEQEGDAYWATAGDYSLRTTGSDFDGKMVGIIILASSYAVSSLIGAIWAGTTVSAHNEQLRRDIESTASIRQPVQPRLLPAVSVTSQKASFGFSLHF